MSWTIESVREAAVAPEAVFALYADPDTAPAESFREPWMIGALLYPDVFWKLDAVRQVPPPPGH
jgi:hypothetical protein